MGDSLHPTGDTLSSYGLGKLDDRSAEEVNKHLEQCPDCRKRVAEMSSDSFLNRVRDAQKVSGKPSGFGVDRTLSFVPPKTAPSAAPPADTLPPGLADNPDYEIKRELGRGGMGVVYLGHNTLMGRDEVLKVIGRQIMDRVDVLERFLREIRAVAKLRHPNIVTAYSAVRLGESIVFSMEYVEGYDLSVLVKGRGPLPVAHACNFVYQTALGLQHAHEEGLVHRDIKPANLMLSKKAGKATVKILDFGLAKVVREQKADGGLTSEGQALGTPDYIAPEQILDAQSADIRADIYSLGGTLYYLLTGHPPFKASSLYDIYQAHISRDADPLNIVRPEVPAELAALVAKMMAKDPARRFQTPGEVARALTPFFRKANAAFHGPTTDASRAGPRPAARVAPVVHTMRDDRPRSESVLASLIDEIVLETPEVETEPEGSGGDAPTLPRWPLVAAAAGGLLALLFGIIIYFRSDKNGTTLYVGDSKGLARARTAPVSETETPARKAAESTPTAGVGSGSPSNATERPGWAPVGEPVVATELPRGWVSLYNGKDLTGWKTHASQPGHWRVENGSLTGSGPGVSHLYTTRDDFRNFHLRIEARYRKGGRAGVLFHSTDEPGFPATAPAFPKAGYKCTINSALNGKGNTGSLHRVDNTQEFTFNSRGTQVPADRWFTLDILATDNSLTAFVDGKLSSQIVSDPHAYPTGHLALQQNTPETVIEFRTVAIKEYDPQAKAAPNEVARLVGHGRRVSSLAFSSDGARLLTGGDTRRVWQGGTQYGSNTIRLWDVASGRNTRTFPGNEPFVTGTAFSPDDKLVATCGGWWDPKFEDFVLIDLITGRMNKLKREDAAGRGVAQAVSFTRDGRRVLAAYANGTVQPWDLGTTERLPLIRLKAGESGIEEFPGLLFMSDQQRLATGSRNGPVELWDLASGDRRAVFVGHVDAVVALARSDDDRLILSGGAEGTAILWDVAGQKRLRVLECKGDGLRRVALSPNGRLAVTGGQYGDIRLWDLATGREVGRFEGHTMGVNALAFSPDGRLVASASDDMTARLWRLPEAVGR